MPAPRWSSARSNTLPLEIYALISSATSPMLFAIGTVTTAVSFLLIGLTLFLVLRIQRRSGAHRHRLMHMRQTHGEYRRIPRFDVELIAVTKRYGDTVAVDRISLRIPRSSYCCLLGPSGCGKTTTLRMIAGHEAITEGTS